MSLTQQQLFYTYKTVVQKHRNRKNHNQYFTPEFVAEKALSFISGTGFKNIIDPAVGNGVFLEIASRKWKKAKLFGIEIDKEIISRLNKSKLPNAYFACGNSILQKTWQLPEVRKVLSEGGFDLVIGNPPFSSWFHRVGSKDTLSNYELGRNNGHLRRSQAIEVLFLEIFIRIAGTGGSVAIVLPDGILSNPQYQYVREFILENTRVIHIINLPRNVFEQTSAKTSILILEKKRPDNLDYLANLYDLEKTGVINNMIEIKAATLVNRMDYWYYQNSRKSSTNELINNGLKFVPLRNLVVYCKTGKTIYGKERKFSDKGLRFLHATNITDVGINYKKDEKFINPLSKMNFPNAYARVGDILFVRVGVGCAGRVAIVDTEADEGIATDYIHIFRVKDTNPYFLILYLKTKFGKDSINLLKHGVGTVSINKTDLLSLPIPTVSENIQFEIERRYKSILSKYRMALENSNFDINAQMKDLTNFAERNILRRNVMKKDIGIDQNKLKIIFKDAHPKKSIRIEDGWTGAKEIISKKYF